VRVEAGPDLEVRHLRRLVEVADHGSVAAAARALGVPASRIGAQLLAIEEQVGGSLFDRTASGLVPTLRGAEAIEAARSVLADLSELVAAVREPDREVLRVVGLDALLAPAVVGLAGARPGLRIASGAAAAADALEALRSDRADIALAVRWPHGPWRRPAEQRRLGRHPLRLLVPAAHPLARRGTVDLADLATDVWAVRADADAEQSVVAECRRHGFEVDPRYRLAGDDELVELVAAGRAVTLTAHPVPRTDGTARLAYRGAAVAEWLVAWRPQVDGVLVDRVVGAVEEWESRRGWAEAVGPPEDRVGSAARPLRVAAPPELAAVAGLPRLRTVHGIHVVVEAVDEGLADAVDSGAADMALDHSNRWDQDRPPVRWPSRVVVRDQPVLISVAEAGASGPVPLAALADAAWAVPASPARQAALRALCGAAGFAPKVAAVYEHPTEVAAGVASGALIRQAEPGTPAAGAVLVPVDHPVARRDVVLLWRPDPELDELADVLTVEFRRAGGVDPRSAGSRRRARWTCSSRR
jgi:DNA-binding transcriptional LysR family regulator